MNFNDESFIEYFVPVLFGERLKKDFIRFSIEGLTPLPGGHSPYSLRSTREKENTLKVPKR